VTQFDWTDVDLATVVVAAITALIAGGSLAVAVIALVQVGRRYERPHFWVYAHPGTNDSGNPRLMIRAVQLGPSVAHGVELWLKKPGRDWDMLLSRTEMKVNDSFEAQVGVTSRNDFQYDVYGSDRPSAEAFKTGISMNQPVPVNWRPTEWVPFYGRWKIRVTWRALPDPRKTSKTKATHRLSAATFDSGLYASLITRPVG
jgi:hypothetical protein